ncbi:MAG TPA: sensor histidine kinase [Candidatus Dormibacteraeota bacterium]|nr:sensor histidine kinase [Candidatus Dormibacteraeota bacterium]
MERLLHAIDGAMLGRWSSAKAELHRAGDASVDAVAARLLAFVDQLERAEHLRGHHASMLKHEIGNPLAIAQATLEGMLDGVLERSDAGLETALEAVEAAGAMLGEVSREPKAPDDLPPIMLAAFTICSVVVPEIEAISPLASSKGVGLSYHHCGGANNACTLFRGDPSRIRLLVRNVLINAVRFTPPSGAIELRCDRDGTDLTLEIAEGDGVDHGESRMGLAAVNQLLRNIGGSARIDSITSRGTALVIALPAAAI